jgi:hypothetical protein
LTVALRDDSPIENFQTFSERLLAEGFDVYRDDFGNVRIRKMSRTETMIEHGARRFAPLLQALVKPDDELSEQDRRTICLNDPRIGFHPHDAVAGARSALCEKYQF